MFLMLRIARFSDLGSSEGFEENLSQILRMPELFSEILVVFLIKRGFCRVSGRLE